MGIDRGELNGFACPPVHRLHFSALGDPLWFSLLSDRYEAYSAYAKHNEGVTHADCLSDSWRRFEQAADSEPTASAEALALIGAIPPRTDHP